MTRASTVLLIALIGVTICWARALQHREPLNPGRAGPDMGAFAELRVP